MYIPNKMYLKGIYRYYIYAMDENGLGLFFVGISLATEYLII